MRKRVFAIAVIAPFLSACSVFHLSDGQTIVPHRMSPYIFGLHAFYPEYLISGGEQSMTDAGKRGWIFGFARVSQNDGSYNNNADFASLANEGYGVMVRVDARKGSVPCVSQYDSWAQHVANYVRNSSGVHAWVIGNETNFEAEFPDCNGGVNNAPVTPQQYATVFKKVRAAIHSVSGHGTDLVISEGVAPPSYHDGPNYNRNILEAIGEGNIDGFAIHAYTTDHNPIDIENRFRSEYRNILGAVPVWARSLPVWITETCPVDGGWTNENNGWIRRMYAEVNKWNQTPGTQKIYGAMLFIWGTEGEPRWDLRNFPAVVQDWREAMNNEYRWSDQPAPAFNAEAPSVPQKLSASFISSSQIDLFRTASQDK